MKRDLTNQELVDRYVHSVTMMLPGDKMGDIGAEIRSNLDSLVEDRAASLGRELSREELSALLKQNGHPVSVANRYHDKPRRALIGPELFPFYWFTLRAALSLIATILVTIAAYQVQGESDPARFLLQFGGNVLLALVCIAALVTVLFAAGEYREFKYRVSERWKPESLPPVPAPVRRPKQPSPVVQIAGGVAWIFFWANTWYLPGIAWVWGRWAWGGAGVFSLSAAAHAMRLPLLLLAVVGISQMWLEHTRFAAAEWRGFLRIAVSLAAIVIDVYLLSHGDFLVTGPHWNPAQAKTLATLNHMIGGTLVLLCLVSVLHCVHELRCMMRGVDRGNRTAHSTS